MEKNINKKRERKRVAPFDVVVVLLIVCLIAAFGYRVYNGVSDPNFKKDSKYVVTFTCDEEYNSIAKYLENGEAVYFAGNGELLGHLYVKKAGDAVVTLIGDGNEDESSSESQELIYEKVKLMGSLKLTADALAVTSGNYYTIGDVNIAKGSVIDVYTEDTVFTLKVESITAIN